MLCSDGSLDLYVSNFEALAIKIGLDRYFGLKTGLEQSCRSIFAIEMDVLMLFHSVKG